MSHPKLRCGHIYLVDLGDTVGAEMQKRRPAVVLNEDGMGRLPLRIVAPITQWKKEYGEFEWMVHLDPGPPPHLHKESGVDCFQTRSISVERVEDKIGEVPTEKMEEINAALRLILGL